MSEIVDCIAWIVRKIAWSLWVFLEFTGKRMLDLFGLIFNLTACCSIIRLPHMIYEFKNMDSFWEWRFVGLFQLCILISDLPIAIMGLFILLTVVRVPKCQRDLKEKYSGFSKSFVYSGWKLRGVIIKHFFKSWIDIFCVPTAFLVLISWRSVIFVRKMKATTSTSKRRKYCFKEFFQLMVDILLLPFFVSILSWRLPFLIQKIRKRMDDNDEWNEIRYIGLQQFLLLLLDIPCIILFVITMVTWRAPLVIYKIRRSIRNNESHKQMHMRKTVIFQFALLFLDIPCIVAGLFVLVTLWRIPPFIQGIKKALNKRANGVYKTEFKIRAVCLVEFGMIFVDLLCFVSFIIVLCTLWRAYPLYKNIRKYYRKYKEQNNSGLHVVVDDPVNEERVQETSLTPREEINNKSPSSEANVGPVIEESSQDNTTTDEHQQQQDTPMETPHDFGTENVPSTDSDSKNDDASISDEKTITATTPIDETSDTTVPEAEHTSTENGNSKESEAKKQSKFSMWKIRKTIAIQFAFLFIDLPAIPLCIFLLITGLRTTKLMSELLGGDFYMMFAVTVYYQFLHFIIEMFFIIIFLFLCIRKPVFLWTLLLEDDEHKSSRLVRHIMQWIPDIVKDRHKYYERLKEIRALNFKQGFMSWQNITDTNEEFQPFLNRLDDVLERLEKHEIEDEFVYLVKCVIFMEKKRTNKFTRHLDAEAYFLNRPDVDIHEKNIRRLHAESIKYEQEVDSMYEKLLNYQPPKVPLYTSKSGLSLRTREETKKVLIDCLPRDDLLVVFGCILCLLPVYRGPTLINRLAKSWYNRIEILKETLYEYCLDIITILRIILVVAFIYRAPFMFADILDCIIKKRSWRAVRKIVKNYPGFIVDDIFQLLRSIFSWDSIRFVFTAFLFGVLMPADLFLTVSKTCIKDKCFAFLLTSFLYIIFMGFPFVFAFYGGEKIMEAGLAYINIAVLCVFFIVLLLILLLMVTAVARDSSKTFSMVMPEVDYIRYSWYNFHVVLFELLEFFQALALIFKLPSIPMYGGPELSTASKYLLFSFVPFKPVFWTTVAFFVVWFFLCAAPVIFENILEIYSIGTYGKRPSWRLLLSLFANTLFLTFVENLVSFSACNYKSVPCRILLDPEILPSLNNITGNVTAITTGIPRISQIMSNGTIDNTTCVTSTFVEDNSLLCWANPHRDYAAFALFALVWYTTTALIFDTQYGDPDTTEQDIGFSPIYNTVINVFKAMMVVAVTIVTNDPNISLVCLLVLNVLSVLFTFLFKTMFNYYPCNVPAILVWRAFTFISSCIVTVAVLVAYGIDEKDSEIPLIIMTAGIGVTLLISIIAAFKLRRISDTEKDRESFRNEIQLLEKRLEKNHWLLTGWDKKRKIWYRLVRSVRSAQKRDKTLVSTSKKTSIDKRGSYQTYGVSTPLSEEHPLPPPRTPPEGVDDIPPPLLPSAVGDTPGDQMNLPPPPSFEAVQKNQELYDVTQIQAASFSDDILKLEKNGRNLLLVLEKYIDHKAYNYAFFTQRKLWLDSAWNCNWKNLLQCLRVLNSNLQGTFDRPTQLDISLAPKALETDLLDDDPQDNEEPPPPFVRQTKEMIENTSKQCRAQALIDLCEFATHGDDWKQILERILPDIPIIRSWQFNAGHFILVLRRPVTGTITEIEDDGNKLAKGASVKIGKKLSGYINGDHIHFHDNGQPSGQKGPVNVVLTDVSLQMKGVKQYVVVNQKNKVPLATVIASSKTIKWV